MNTNKIYNFSGRGNFSEWFGWDDGLAAEVGEEVTLDKALEDQRQGVEYSSEFNFAPLSSVDATGVFVTFFNEHGGSRNVQGFVVAASAAEARQLLDGYCEKYPVKEYEG